MRVFAKRRGHEHSVRSWPWQQGLCPGARLGVNAAPGKNAVWPANCRVTSSAQIATVATTATTFNVVVIWTNQRDAIVLVPAAPPLGSGGGFVCRVWDSRVDPAARVRTESTRLRVAHQLEPDGHVRKLLRRSPCKSWA
jgi:hypothetical protein